MANEYALNVSDTTVSMTLSAQSSNSLTLNESTTIPDGTISYKKLISGTLGYVTPQMYGAVGDGTTDDTAAFQSAIDTGMPIVLIGSYLCGELTGENVTIIGNGTQTIYHADDGTLFSLTGTFYGEHFNIENQAVFNYDVNDAYGTISALNIYCKNVNFTNVNCSAFYLTGNCVIDSCVIDNGNFDVKNLYDGSIANRMFGVYVHQSTDTHIVAVKNCDFSYLIEGVYIGTYVDGYAEMLVDNCRFDTIGDHAVYCNSYEDRVHAVISNNLVLKTTGSFVVAGNGHVVENNKVYGAYDGARVLFGFSVRNGSNIIFRNNEYISGTYTTTSGIGTNAIIQSTLTGKGHIVFEGNTFIIDDQGSASAWLRIGTDGVEMGDIVFRNNYMSIKGGVYGIQSTITANLHLISNQIYFTQHPFLELGTTKVIMDSNYVENLETSKIFQISSYGIYKNNTFNTLVTPLRRPSDLLYVVENNTNEYAAGVYNLGTGVDTTNLVHKCLKTGTFTSTGTAYIYDLDDIRPAFYNKLLIFDDLGNAVDFTVTSIVVGQINLTIEAGTYHYILL